MACPETATIGLTVPNLYYPMCGRKGPIVMITSKVRFTHTLSYLQLSCHFRLYNGAAIIDLSHSKVPFDDTALFRSIGQSRQLPSCLLVNQPAVLGLAPNGADSSTAAPWLQFPPSPVKNCFCLTPNSAKLVFACVRRFPLFHVPEVRNAPKTKSSHPS